MIFLKDSTQNFVLQQVFIQCRREQTLQKY